MNSMIQPISAAGLGAAQPAAVSGAGRPQDVRQPGDTAPARSPRVMMDEYVPEEKQEPSGRYWLGRDENGRPKVCFDDPERASGAPENGEKPAGTQGPGQKAPERCTANTDQVDREIERLKRKQETLEQQLSAQTDTDKARSLEQQLAQVKCELGQKDNDAYRRQHTVFS